MSRRSIKAGVKREPLATAQPGIFSLDRRRDEDKGDEDKGPLLIKYSSIFSGGPLSWLICKLRPRFIACFRFISGGPLSCVQLRTGVNMRMKSVLILLLLVGVSGCRSTSMEYDLSTSAPFSAYSNLTVELRKPMILFKDHQGQYELHGINPEDMRTGIVLPTGYM